MPRLLLVRHGDTDFNQHRRFMGYSDIALSALGERQITRLRAYITAEKIDAVFTSDLKRTTRTARILAAGRRLQIISCPELRELNYGVCEGLSFREINIRYPEVAAKCLNFSLDLEFPEGENFRSFIKRARTFTKRLKVYGDDDTVLVVSHSGPLKVLVCHFIGLPMKNWQMLHLDTASLSIVYTNPTQSTLTRLNDTSFLRDTN